MVGKPYDDDDDDAPTLQRAVSGPAARLGSVSGLRPAAVIPFEELVASAFEEEATTAVDRPPVDPLESPADTETTTANLPIDVAAVLRHASMLSEPPPSLAPPTEVMIPPRAPSSHDG